MFHGLNGGPDREEEYRRDYQDGRRRKRKNRLAHGGEIGSGAMNSRDAEDPIGGKRNRHSEHSAGAQDCKAEQDETSGQKWNVDMVPVAAGGAVYSQRIPETAGIAIQQILDIDQGDRQADAAVGCEQKPVLAAAKHGSRSEQHNGAVDGPCEQATGEKSAKRGSGPRTVGGRNVGLLDNPANAAIKGERESDDPMAAADANPHSARAANGAKTGEVSPFHFSQRV